MNSLNNQPQTKGKEIMSQKEHPEITKHQKDCDHCYDKKTQSDHSEKISYHQMTLQEMEESLQAQLALI